MSNSYKIAVLGDRDSVLGFRTLGLDIFAADTVEEARSILHRLAKEEYAVVYLTEQYARRIAAQTVEEGFDAFNLQRFDGQEITPAQL